MPDITIVNANVTDIHQLPLGALLITATLQKAGFDVKLRDYQTFRADRKPSVSTFLTFLRDIESDIIGISVMCNSLPTVLGGIRYLKAEQPQKTIILGGPAATDLPEAIMRCFPVDVIVVGEGEKTITELAAAMEDGRDVAGIEGLCYRHNATIVMAPRRKRICSLDDLPFPAYDQIDLADYGPAAGTVITARGCPYHCTFCSAHSVWQRLVRNRGVGSVVEEAAYVARQVGSLLFVDDTFVLDPERVATLLKALRATGVDVPWRCNGRVGLMTDDLLRLMADYGCVEVFYGIESGSDSVLHAINKGFTVEMARCEVDRTLRYIDRVTTSYIWGFPFETMEDFYQTVLSFGHDTQSRGVYPQIGLLAPLPQSPLYRDCRKTARFLPEIRSSVMLPHPQRLTDYPELVELIKTFPQIFAPFTQYEHSELRRKYAIIERLTREAV
jgi:radical SAM superfamily enzyme YgiQ (UPF0313 family)